MSQSSQPAALESIESDWIVLKRIEAAKQGALAAAVGLDPSTLSNFLNGKGAIKAPQLRLLLEALGLKCVDKESKCVRAETFLELTRIAGRAILERPQLVWDEH